MCAICTEFYTPRDVIFSSAKCQRDDEDEEPTALPAQWVPLDISLKKLPKGVFKSGFDDRGNTSYVARVYLNDDLLPASYVAKTKTALCSWDCRAYEFTELELRILTDCHYKWVAGTKGSYPPGALQAGHSEDGEVTYTGRGQYRGITRLGKVHPSHGVMYLPHRGLEVNIPDYEVLVVVP
ncbi:uncharacterized protein LOC108030229 [Drosophila biarmipes]|uniref:uncharacterized protein LOC108030229 n=1 Tax=Drosophila biarmipes TaxID=125945 RepID=UPI0021CD0BF3|nr:uncharacterized protein LOC108030229 [Drosophila biarmipes]